MLLQILSLLGPIEDISIHIIGDLTQTRQANKFLHVIVDLFTKLMKTVPFLLITELDIAKALTAHWAFTYGFPKSLLKNNGMNFNHKLFSEANRILNAEALFSPI